MIPSVYRRQAKNYLRTVDGNDLDNNTSPLVSIAKKHMDRVQVKDLFAFDQNYFDAN